MHLYFSEIIVPLDCIAEMDDIEAFVGSSFPLRCSSCADCTFTRYCFHLMSEKKSDEVQYVYVDILSQTINRLCFYLSMYKRGNRFFLLQKNHTISCVWEREGNIHEITSQVCLQNQFLCSASC